MMVLFSVAFICLGMSVLHLLSSKQFEKTKKSRLNVLTVYATLARYIAFILFIVATLLLILEYGSSIGFVSWWLFASPIIFILILYFNDLKPKADKKAR